MLELLIAVIIVGVALYLIRLIPMDERLKTAVTVIVIAIVVIYLLRLLLGGSGGGLLRLP